MAGERFKIPRVRTMTLNLSDGEMELLEQLAERLGATKSATLRQAIRYLAAAVERGRPTDLGP